MEWLRAEIAHGLQALLALRLENTPAEDMIELTADIWYRAFSQRVDIETVDAPRIRKGFDKTFPLIRKWPAPIDVLKEMPSRPPRPRLPAPEPSPEEHREQVERVKVMVDDLLKGMLVKEVLKKKGTEAVPNDRKRI